jgi:hypothetical protein
MLKALAWIARGLGLTLSGPIGNILRKKIVGAEVLVFEHAIAKDNSTVREEIAAFKVITSNLPKFRMHPEGVLDKIVSALGRQDIDFDTHPEFSRSYRLEADDESAARRLFKPAVLEYFSKYRGWSVEGEGKWLIAFKPGVEVPRGGIEEFLKETTEIARLFGI